jgi:hypothetical protein
MTVVPADTPVTTPVPLTAVATLVVPLVHVPPVVASVNVIVEPAQKAADAGMVDGVVLTVTIAVAVQPVPNEYVIMAVPETTPVTIPLLVPTVATDVVPLVQFPLVVPSVKVIVVPEQKAAAPDIAVGKPFTVMTFVALHPVLRV